MDLKRSMNMNSGAGAYPMRDNHRYKSKRGYSSRLYNLAWARAVQSKSMDNVKIRKNTAVDERKKTSPSPPAHTFISGRDDNAEIECIVVGRVVEEGSCGRDSKVDNDDEVKDDELEEGEIESSSDSETVEKLMQGFEEDKFSSDVNEGHVSDIDCENVLETMVKSVDETLQEFTGSVSEKTFVEVCSRIEVILEGLWGAISSSDDDVVGRTFSSIEKVNSVFCSMNQNQKQQCQEVLSSLLVCALSQTPSLFSTDQVKEMDMMMLSLADPSMFCNEESSALEMEIENCGGLSEIDIDELYRNTNPGIKSSMAFDLPSFNHIEEPRHYSISETSFSLSNTRRSSELLLDLQKDYDADTLPSPTRESQNVGFIIPDSSMLSVTKGRVQASASRPYETDALKAVSTYQQKFGKTSFSSSDLPSPTPSDNNNSEDDDAVTEVSSGQNEDFIQPMKSPHVEIMASNFKEMMDKNGLLVYDTSHSKPVTRSQSRSRDPRLRQVRSTAPTSNLKGLRKQVPNEETCVIGPPTKRLRRPLVNSKSCESREEDKGVLVEKGVMGTSMGIDVPVSDENGDKDNMGLELSSILKDISVNPTLLIKLLKLDHISDKPLSSPVGNALGDVLTQDSGNEPAKIKMKPRDPRRILQNGTMKFGTTGSEQIVTSVCSGTNPGGNGTILSHGKAAPDITHQFTNNLKNIADLISLTPISTPVVSQIPSMLSAKVSTDRIGKKSGILDADETKPGVVWTPDDAHVGSVPPQHRGWEDMEHLLEGYDEQQKAAIHKERARRMEEQKRMFSARKLCLVLDLDHTLLNSAKFFEVDPVHDEILRRKEELDREKHRRHLFRFPHMGMWTKLRPGIWNFLVKASKLYELHLYTMGNKPYATEMAKILDPKGVLFSGRVISRGDDGDVLDGDERTPKNKDLEGVLGMESAVVIIDDSVRVWPHNKLNLIVVERYTYFPCSRRQFGLPGPSLLEIDHDERPEEGTLASSLSVIEKIHRTFFSQPSLDDVDVRNILGSEQKRILSGCRVVFSRIFPVGEANPHMHPLWQTAEQFGATCTNQIDEQVTHVVANSLGTDKVNWALSTGRWVVHPGWVEASSLLYRRANEKDFAVKS